MSESKDAIESLDYDEQGPVASAGSADVDMVGNSMITLISVNQERISVPRKICQMSEMVTTALEKDKEAEELPIYTLELKEADPVPEKEAELQEQYGKADPTIDSDYLVMMPDVKTGQTRRHLASGVTTKYLKMAVEFMTHYAEEKEPWQEIERPLKSTKLEECLPAWDYAFIRKHATETHDNYELIRAANYLSIQPLLALACAHAAHCLVGKTTEQMREMLHIVNDWTKEEEDKLIEENKWVDML